MNTDDFAPCKPFRLSAGGHNGPKEGMCAMEMLSWFAGEEWSDAHIERARELRELVG